MGLLSGSDWDPEKKPELVAGVEAEEAAIAKEPVKPKKGPRPIVRLQKERRRAGKVVTVLRGLDPKQHDLKALLRKLQSSCGVGGSLDGEDIVLQGELLDRLRPILTDWGFLVKG